MMERLGFKAKKESLDSPHPRRHPSKSTSSFPKLSPVTSFFGFWEMESLRLS